MRAKNYFRLIGAATVSPNDKRRVDGVTPSPANAAIPGVNKHFHQLIEGDVFHFVDPDDIVVFVREGLTARYIIVRPILSEDERQFEINNWNDIVKVRGNVIEDAKSW